MSIGWLSSELWNDLAVPWKLPWIALGSPTAATARSTAAVACDSDTAVNEVPYEAIIDAADRHGCDLIFMASHGRRGMAGLLLGSETQKVLTHSKTPVLVYR